MAPPKQPPSDLQIAVNATRREVEVVKVRTEVIDQRLDRIATMGEAIEQQLARLSELRIFGHSRVLDL